MQCAVTMRKCKCNFDSGRLLRRAGAEKSYCKGAALASVHDVLVIPVKRFIEHGINQFAEYLHNYSLLAATADPIAVTRLCSCINIFFLLSLHLPQHGTMSQPRAPACRSSAVSVHAVTLLQPLVLLLGLGWSFNQVRRRHARAASPAAAAPECSVQCCACGSHAAGDACNAAVWDVSVGSAITSRRWLDDRAPASVTAAAGLRVALVLLTVTAQACFVPDPLCVA